MSKNYNESLQLNNSSLEEIIVQLNSMPDAGDVDLILQDKTVVPTKNVQSIVADDGYNGLATVTVESIPENYIVPVGTLAIYENGIYDVTDKERVNVDVVAADNRLASFLEGGISDLNETIAIDVKSLTTNAIYGRSELVSIALHNLTYLGPSGIRNCSNLKKLNLPKVTAINQYSCAQNAKLTAVNIPKVTVINSAGFQGCSSLQVLELGTMTSIGANAFNNCAALQTLIIRQTTGVVCSLSATSAFTNTPIANGTGYIYVPASLVNVFKNATNWSTFSAQFRAIEDYPEITGG